MRLSTLQRESLAAATFKYSEALAGSPADEYLAGRGITLDVAQRFHLGYVDVPEVGHDAYVGRLAIPYVTPAGPVDIRFRSLSGDGPKYLTRPGAQPHLYNVTAFGEDSDVIALTEGELDAVVAHGLAGIPAIGVPGANAWKPFYARAFLDYERVILLCDGDEPGKAWGKRIAQEIEQTIVITMPDGMDTNDIILAEGSDGLRKRAGL